MDLDIRGEMEQAAKSLEAEGQDFETEEPATDEGTPASEPEETTDDAETTDEVKPEPEGEPEEKADDSPAKEGDPKDTPAKKESSKATPPDDDELPKGGSIPVARVRKILENARAKARAEVEAEFAWAKELGSTEDTSEAVRVWKFANEHPLEFAQEIVDRVTKHPALADRAKQIFAKQDEPARQPKPDPEQADPKPQPDVLLEDGRLVYSSEQSEKLVEWKVRALKGEVEKTMEPLLTERSQAQHQREVDEHAQRVITEVMKWPGMNDAENQKAVAMAMKQHGIQVDAAYRAVVLPKLTDTAAIEKRVRAQVLDELKQKSRASARPPARSESSPVSLKGKSVREILEATADEIGFDPADE